MSLVAVVSELVQRYVPVLQDPAQSVLVELAPVDELAAAVYGEELARLIGVIFCFECLC